VTARPPKHAITTTHAPLRPSPWRSRHGRPVALCVAVDAGRGARRAAAPTALGARRHVSGAYPRSPRRRRPGGIGEPSPSRRAARCSGHWVRLGPQSPWRLRPPWRRGAGLARACFRVATARCRGRGSSAAPAGPWPPGHPCRSPGASRSHMRSPWRTSHPSLWARRRRRLPSREAASTTWCGLSCPCNNRCSQTPARPAS
jgi:hypothetical protein